MVIAGRQAGRRHEDELRNLRKIVENVVLGEHHQPFLIGLRDIVIVAVRLICDLRTITPALIVAVRVIAVEQGVNGAQVIRAQQAFY
jgi:hypothetical protein